MRSNLLLIATIFVAFNIHCQNFISVTKNSDGQTITLTNDQVLEIKLPCKPSTGYGWYVTSINKDVITQTGNWEFESQEPRAKSQENGMVGQPGTEVIRFIGVSQGRSVLALEYKRPWEKDIPSIDIFKLTLNSNGKYTGNYNSQQSTVNSQQSIIKRQQSSAIKGSASLPSSFSWQAQCTPIKNQGNCGSCWAFASTGSFEAVINIIDGNQRNLSEQFLINCAGPAPEFEGCQGGFCPDKYWVSPGSVYENDLQYADINCYNTYSDTARCMGTCGTYTYHEKADSTAMVDGRTPPIDKIKEAIYNYGPLWACVDVGNNFQQYKGGIFTDSGDTAVLNHAIVLVGWKDSTLSNGSSGYWILKNSWGSSFGEHGYMRIGYGVSLIGDSAQYIVYKGGITSCRGVPTPGNTITDANPVCPYVAFTLSLQNATTGKGVTYQWQSSPNNSTWSNISDAINATYVISAADTTYYRCKVICSGDTSTSTALKEMVSPPPTMPTAGKHVPSENQIIWNWKPVSGATGYKWNTMNDYSSAIENGISTSYTQTGLTPNTQYNLYVWSYNSCGNSAVGTLKETTTMTGINEPVAQSSMFKVQCYPNPVTNELIVETSNPDKSGFNIKLTNILGQSIFAIYDLRFTIYKIDMSNLPGGIYIIKIFNEDETVVRKIMKE